MPPGRKTVLLLAGTAVGALALVWLVAGQARGGYRLGPGDDRPPAEPRYQRALQLGLGGDYAGAKREFLQVAADRRGSSAGAWALYQAALAARVEGRAAEATELLARLRAEYAEHPLAVRSGPSPPADADRARRAKPDCGPRSLLYLCREFGLDATLPELRRRCRTDKAGTTLEGLGRAAREKGFRVAAVQVDEWFLRRHRPAGIAWVEGDHYVAFLPGTDPGRLWLFDPNEGKRRLVTAEAATERCRGIMLLVARGDQRLPEIKANPTDTRGREPP